METLADLRDGGMGIDELRDWAENNKLRLNHWFFSTDLSYYVKGGRISKTAGLVGTVLGICPLLNMDEGGHLVPRYKIRSKKRVIQEIVRRMELYADDGLDYSGKCFISHSGCYEDARAVADLIESKFKKLNGKVVINYVGTTIGQPHGPRHRGPVLLGPRPQAAPAAPQLNRAAARPPFYLSATGKPRLFKEPGRFFCRGKARRAYFSPVDLGRGMW